MALTLNAPAGKRLRGLVPSAGNVGFTVAGERSCVAILPRSYDVTVGVLCRRASASASGSLADTRGWPARSEQAIQRRSAAGRWVRRQRHPQHRLAARVAAVPVAR